MDDDDDYRVGFGKPPLATQFKKGKSGNPGGRPKRDPPPEEDPSIPSTFRRISRQKVRTNGPDGPQEMSKIEAGITQLVNKFASGDLKAFKLLVLLTSKFPQLLHDDSPEVIRIVFAGPDGQDADTIEEYDALVKKAEEDKKDK